MFDPSKGLFHISQDFKTGVMREFQLSAKLAKKLKIFFLVKFFSGFRKGLPKKKFKFQKILILFSMENP